MAVRPGSRRTFCIGDRPLLPQPLAQAFRLVAIDTAVRAAALQRAALLNSIGAIRCARVGGTRAQILQFSRLSRERQERSKQRGGKKQAHVD